MPRCTYCKEFVSHIKNLPNHQSKSQRCQKFRAQARAALTSRMVNQLQATQASQPLDDTPSADIDAPFFPPVGDVDSEVNAPRPMINIPTPDFDQDAVPPMPGDAVNELDLHPCHEEIWDEDFPPEKRAGASIGSSKTLFETYRDQQVVQRAGMLGPFESEAEWELAKWLIKNVGHNQAEEFLKLPIVSQAFIFLTHLCRQHLRLELFDRYETVHDRRTAQRRNC